MCKPVHPQLFYSNYVPRKEWRLSVALTKLSLTMSHTAHKSMGKINMQNEKYIFIRTQITHTDEYHCKITRVIGQRQIEIIILFLKYWAFILIFYYH